MKIQYIIINQQGASAILLTIMMLSSIIFVAVMVSDLVQNGIVASRTQVDSTKALFAAEAGIEQVLDSIWKPMISPICAGPSINEGYICFNLETGGVISSDPLSICSNDCQTSYGWFDYQNLPNRTTFSIYFRREVDGSHGTTTFSSLGVYNDVNRVVESKYIY